VRSWIIWLSGTTVVLGIGVAGTDVPAVAAPLVRVPTAAGSAPVGDDLPDRLEAKRRQNRAVALDMVLNGKASVERRATSNVVRVGSTVRKSGRVDQYAELAREKTDRLFVVLAEFGDARHPNFPDQDTDPATPGPVRFDGPSHNQIPEPDRKTDTFTVWQADFNRKHYQDLYFGSGPRVESLKTYYEAQSSGRYSVDGLVTDWVKVKYNEARYGRSNGFPCAGSICSNTWELVRDAVDAWVADQHRRGRTDTQIKADLAAFDVWDRFDHDGDGDFNEPDGYIDHFQIVHAGGSQTDGDPTQGEDAIYSHSWAAFEDEPNGPPDNRIGGTEIGTTGLWVRDYTIQPENSGLGIVAHEYAHDLGLPDEYDSTAADNAVNWWTLMAQSRFTAAGDVGVGIRAGSLGAWDKLQLGWLDHEVINAGDNRTIELDPHRSTTTKPEGVVVRLPKKRQTTQLADPPEGTKQWWSSTGNGLDSTLSHPVTLPTGPATLRLQAFWDIEDCGPDPCDYAYVEVDDGSGAGYTAIAGSITNLAEGNGIDGTSDGWKPATFDLSAYAGKTITVRLRYVTDPAVSGLGFFADDIRVTAGSTTVFADGAEGGVNGWTAAGGFSIQGSSVTSEFDNYYIASYRSYQSFDRYLQTGPFNFGFGAAQLVEHFPYQEGLLVSYWDTSFEDNDTSVHPGHGMILPIDAHPDLINLRSDQPWGAYVQAYDAPFSLRKADTFTLHADGQPVEIRGESGVARFDDSRSYYRENLTAGVRYGVKVPNHGVRIEVLSTNGASMRIRVTG
jgi:immune inhibitor A